MTDFFNFINALAEQYGNGVAASISGIFLLVYIIWMILKNYSALVTTLLEHSKKRAEKEHEEAMLHRKKITPQIKEELNKLAKEVGGDRALLFEYTNGTSNLIGLPFFYASATCEVISGRAKPIQHLYQRFSITSVYDFIEELECKGYYYIEDLEKEKDSHLMLYNYMHPNGVHSAIFYTLVGMHDTIGFIVVTTIEDRKFTRDEALPKIAVTAQKISSMLNFNEIHEDIGHDRERKRFKLFKSSNR